MVGTATLGPALVTSHRGPAAGITATGHEQLHADPARAGSAVILLMGEA